VDLYTDHLISNCFLNPHQDKSKTLEQHPPAPRPSPPLSISFPSPFLWMYRNHLMTSPPLRLSFFPVPVSGGPTGVCPQIFLLLTLLRLNFSLGLLVSKQKLSVLDNSSLNITHWAHILGFYARQLRVIAIATCLSVRLSVCPSVTRRYCVKTIYSPSGSPMILVFWCQISSPHSKGSPRAGPQTRVGWENSAIS